MKWTSRWSTKHWNTKWCTGGKVAYAKLNPTTWILEYWNTGIQSSAPAAELCIRSWILRLAANLRFSTGAIYQTLPLVPKSSFFSKNGQKVRVYRFHFYLKNRKSKRETKTHARRMLPPPPHHHLCLIFRRTQISWPKWNSEEKLPKALCIYI